MDFETFLAIAIAVVTGAQLLLGVCTNVAERFEKHSERVAEGMRACERSPEIWPRISTLAIVPWSLRLPWFGLVARRVSRLGFREIGCRMNETPTHSLPSRVFHSERHRTYALMFSFFGTPRVVFMSGLDDGSIVNTGCTDRDERRFGELLDLGVSGGPEIRLAKHLAAMDRWRRERSAVPSCARGGYRGLSSRPSEGTMEASAALGRRYYVVRFRPGHPTLDDEFQRTQAARARRSAA